MSDYERSSVIASSLWMVGISLVLFFLPAINGLIGGAVGGYKAGTAGRAVGAAVLPAVAVFFGVWGLLSAFDHPLIGFISGIAVGVWAIISSIGLFIGALIGGAVAPERIH
jgi:hypothetical protein